ncbi:MAG TPA: hypothetical protein VE988_16275, partial [Gemmataceae bacterium]|nr:hypothetical protein [Gemmataceae bacterium]
NYVFGQNNNPTGFHPNAKFRFYQVKGHLAVIQVGMEAYGIDLGAGTILWQHSLYDPYKAQPNTNWSISMDEQGRLWVLHQNQFGNSVKARVGHIGSVQATYVALITQKGLVVLDPIKGTTLWTKPGLLTNTEIFGDDQHIYYVETAEGAAVGAGRCLRASDGAPVDVTDFGFFYRNKQRIFAGRQILTSEPNGKTVTMRLHDVPTGKELWKRTFANDPAVLTTDDPHQCGVIERETGKLTLLEALTGQEIVVANMKQYRVSDADLKGLNNPVLVDDGEQFFVALNTKDNPSGVVNNTLSNNFSSFTPCLPVNGWLCCLDRKGEFQWHGIDRFNNQFIIVEQFRSLPILLFASRWVEQKDGSAHRKARAFSISKTDGSAIWSFERDGDGRPTYFSFNVDLKGGTVNMIGQDTSLFVHQHYLETKGDQKKGVGGPAAGGKDAGPPDNKADKGVPPVLIDPAPPKIKMELPPLPPLPQPPVIPTPPLPPIKKAGLVDANANETPLSPYLNLTYGYTSGTYYGIIRPDPPALQVAKK